ncbi:hypothetical protein HDU88_008175 [Geranomyces variabilis]|nr:hypothetical protein HDU88_008175 [Geranomyces variabilis]
MPNNKKKKISKIDNAATAHPYSRKATQLRRALNRDDKLHTQKKAGDVKKTRIVDRMLWFKYALDDDLVAATLEHAHEVVRMYIARHDDEIDEIVARLRKGRPPPGRLELLRNLRAKDQQEYNNGIEIPNLTDAKNVAALKAWEGDYNGMAQIKSVVLRADAAPAAATAESPATAAAASATSAKPLEAAIATETGMDVDA